MSSITIGPEHNGRVIQADIGDTVILRLPENPTTGVRWDLRIQGPLEVDADGYDQLSEKPAVGASSIRVFTLRVRDSGNAILNLKKWQEWEGESSVEDTFSCSVQIEDGC